MKTLKYLIDTSKEDVNSKNNEHVGDSLLHLAALSNSESQFKIMRYLVEHKANIHAVNINGDSILDYAERSSLPVQNKTILFLKYLTLNNDNQIILFKRKT